ncbi:O-antigen ligase family protein [Paracoccus laeviglucosivorans]|uniref:O-antigen ligase n=1 Tax=Paracoccus laeviglucosivorans TaxID=1197861 RepID=A0A521ERW4_9RHOB|nr:O-antigen ligase family protein [Paracoccus laeviglucosivorans]SMO86655.1 O-antigen ligase [Paracoccus laeviglucosivorans]
MSVAPITMPAGRPMQPIRRSRTADKRDKTSFMDWLDSAFFAVVVLFSADAFMFLGLNSIIWLLCYAYIFLRMAMSLSQVAEALERNWVLLLYPALSASSVLWSDLPSETLRFSLQLGVTALIAIFLGSRFSIQQIYRTFFMVMFFTMIVSVMNLTSAITPAYDARDLFQGIFNSKNSLGHRAVLFAVTCAFGILILPNLRPRFRLACVMGLLCVTVVLMVAGSATGILFSVAASGAGMALWFLLRWRSAWAFLAAAAMAALGLFLIASLFTRLDPLSFLLGLVGRDATLTGRTILWDFGWEHYLAHPWLGYGAAGFWDNPHFASDIIALRSRYGEGVVGFHNLIIELLVTLGPMGVVAHCAMTLTALFRTFWHARYRANAYAAWAFTLILAIFGMSMLGAQYFQGHSIVIMLVLILAAAFPSPLAPRTASRMRPSSNPWDNSFPTFPEFKGMS